MNWRVWRKHIPADVYSIQQGLLPKDTSGKLKQIEKLSKRLRSEITPSDYKVSHLDAHRRAVQTELTERQKKHQPLGLVSNFPIQWD